MSKIVEREHGRYLIKAGRLRNDVVARAFPKPPSRLKGLIAESRGKTTDEAIANLIEDLDARQEKRKSARRRTLNSTFTIPLAEEYAEAIRHISPSEKVLDLLAQHAVAGNRGLSAAVLATIGEYSDFHEALKSYEQLAGSVASTLDLEAQGSSRLAIIVERLDDGEAQSSSILILHQELREAVFAICGVRRPTWV